MAATGKSRQNAVATHNRKVRQDALRDQLAGMQHVGAVVKNIEAIENPSTDPDRIPALKAAAELRLRLVNKYLPDLKAIEVQGEVNNTLTVVRKDYGITIEQKPSQIEDEKKPLK